MEELYTIIESKKDTGHAQYRIRINTGHEVFEGHFPGLPILPGALQVEIIKELLGETLGFKLQLKSAKSIKYLGFINPKEVEELVVDLQYQEDESGWKLKAQIQSAEAEKPAIFTKLSGVFIETKA